MNQVLEEPGSVKIPCLSCEKGKSISNILKYRKDTFDASQSIRNHIFTLISLSVSDSYEKFPDFSERRVRVGLFAFMDITGIPSTIL